ncbi:hypothetical protein OROMI_004744 [Orobanche minor]
MSGFISFKFILVVRCASDFRVIVERLRILFSPTSSSSSTRAFIENNYKVLKTKNPKLPILIREATGIQPQLWARFVQVERSFIARREKELTEKMESVEALRTVVENSRAKIEELENQLGLIVTLYQFNLIGGFMPRLASHCFCFSGTKDVKADFQIMGSAISNEMGMMKAQLNCWKETTGESIFLHEKVQPLKSLVDSKTAEEKDLAEKCDQQTQLIRSLKAYIEKKQKENEELQTYVDMVNDNIYDNSRSQAGSSLIFSVCSFARFLAARS